MSDPKPGTIQHDVDDLVITCIDHRFQQAIARLLKDEYRVDIEKSDRIAYAGASKAVAEGALTANIEISQGLHNVKNVWLVDHTDCGGFGGLAAYDNNEQKEIEAHFGSLSRAAEVIKNISPHLVVVPLVVTLDGEFVKPV